MKPSKTPGSVTPSATRSRDLNGGNSLGKSNESGTKPSAVRASQPDSRFGIGASSFAVQNPSVLSAPAAASLQDNTGPNTGKGGGAQRSIDQKFQLNPSSGTFSLAVPIQVSKARSELQPTLELSYDSGFGNGAFGMGWSLSFGVTDITRKTSKGIPKYEDSVGTESDTFILAGHEDLVVADEPPVCIRALQGHDYIVKRYRCRIENEPQVIERWTNVDDNGDIFWRTISPSNQVHFFGRTDQSRIFDASSPKRIFTWLLCEVYDPLGNAMVYVYKEEDEAGISELPDTRQTCEAGRGREARTRARYLKAIKYGNHKPSREAESWEIEYRQTSKGGNVENEWMFEVVLDYGEHHDFEPSTNLVRDWDVRHDPFSTYASGFEIRSYRLCKRILMFHHVPEKLGLEDYLVASCELDYLPKETGSFIRAVTQKGHTWNWGTGQYDTQSLPAISLDYSQVPEFTKLQTNSIKPKLISQLAGTQANPSGVNAQWIDLDGEGISGLLVQLDGTWYYGRNESPLQDPATDDMGLTDDSSSSASGSDSDKESCNNTYILPSLPVHARGEAQVFTDIDGNGSQNLVVLDASGRPVGYYERTEDQDWTTFREFESILSNETVKVSDTGPVRKFDVTGNGLVDFVTLDQSHGQVLWHESLGKKGYAAQRRSRGPGQPVFWDDSDQRTATTLADMSGDGLVDILQLSNGHVSYWPSLGYGCFGSQVIMNNSPLFDQDEDKFDTRRILLADVDGSGAADLLYILSDGGLMLYRNCCGNGFSDGILLPCFPRVSDVSSLFVMDLFGKGTSCICMMEQDTAQEVVIRYFDFNSSPISPTSKPNMLTAFENGVGLRTTITYWPSTKFYLKDQRAGKPWRTKVPFPVLVVQKVVYQDLITGHSKTCRYHYHDGHYDSHDREFRGFGMVEESVRESFLLTNGNRYQKPPSLKKVWYHIGIMGGLAPDSATTFQNPQISSRLPPSLSPDGLYQSSRALRGLELRSELYSPDGTAKAKLPYVVIERSYLVTQEQEPKPSGCQGVFRTHASEILTLNYERTAENPRTQHEIVIQRNSHGDVEKYLDIRYGSKGSLLNGPNYTAQQVNEVRYTGIEYTNAVSGLDMFRKPLVAQSSSYYILGLPIDHQILDGEKLASEDFDQYLVKPVNILNGGHDCYRAEKSKILYRSMRTIYRSQDMTGPLSFKELEPFSIVDQVFELALDRERHLQIYGPSDKTLSRFGRDYTTILEREGLFIDLDDDGNLWAPSSVTYFGTSAAKNMQLPEARRSFFSPTVTEDPFKAQSTVEMDDLYLLPCSWTDANGNVTCADNDYRVLRARTIEDPNNNQSSAMFDSLGRTVAQALRGKQVAESLDGLTANLTPHETAALFNHPTPDLVKKLLGRAGSRIIFSPEPVLGDSKLSPMFQVSMGRAGLDSIESLEGEGDIFFNISYFDGYSQGIQDVSLASWRDHAEKWRYSGSVVLDSNAAAVQVAPPFFSSNHYFIPHATLTSPFVTSFYDGANRISGELYRDHSWVKTCYDDAWSMRQFSREDTVLTEDPRNDPDIGMHFQALSTSAFLPSWRDQRLASMDELVMDSAVKSEAFAHTPVITHFDSGGRPSVISTTDGSVIRTTSFEYDVYGNRNVEIDGAGRVVQKTEFDNLGRAIQVSSLDSGNQISLCDCLGEVIVTQDSRGVLKRYVRDDLRRVTQTWVAEDKLDGEVLWSEVVYGDNREYFPDGSQQSNSNNRVARIHDQSGVRTFEEYDIRGNCTMSTMQLAAEYRSLFNATPNMALEPEIWSTKSVFDAINRERQSKDPTGTVTVRSYNFLSQLESVMTYDVANPDDLSVQVHYISYTADGLLRYMQNGNGSHTTWEYNESSRELLLKTTQRDRDAKTIECLRYIYDIGGRISFKVNLAHEDVFFRNRKIDSSNDYLYDGFGRLRRATGREMVDTNGSGPGPSSSSPMSIALATGSGLRSSNFNNEKLTRYAETYDYDVCDNILKICHTTEDERSANWVREYEYSDLEANNRLARTKVQGRWEHYTYDKAGCMTSMSGYSNVGWDAFQRLRSSARQRVKQSKDDMTSSDGQSISEITWFVYNSDGTRVRKVTDQSTAAQGQNPKRFKETLYLNSCDIYRKYYNLGQGSLKPRVETYTSLVKEHQETDSALMLIERSNLADRITRLPRWIVSPGLEVDDKSQVVSYEEYSPFGLTTFELNGHGIEGHARYRFASYLRDRETGLHYCQARYYCPWLGRWLSPDPLGTKDGLNLYHYVGNDPVNWVDPTGTMRIEVGADNGAGQARLTSFGRCKRHARASIQDTRPTVIGYNSTVPRTWIIGLSVGASAFWVNWPLSSGPDAPIWSNVGNLLLTTLVGGLLYMPIAATYDGLVGMCTKGTKTNTEMKQEMKQENEDLKEQISQLKTKNSELEEKITRGEKKSEFLNVKNLNVEGSARQRISILERQLMCKDGEIAALQEQNSQLKGKGIQIAITQKQQGLKKKYF